MEREMKRPAETPSCAQKLGRRAGVVMHLSSLSGAHGIGHIADSAHAFIDELAEMGLTVWQFLPLGPTAYGDSPYQPLSAFAGNANLIGLNPLVQDGLLRPSELDVLADLPTEYCDFGRLIPAKRALLMAASRRLRRRGESRLLAEFEAFRHDHAGWLEDYALFRVLKTAHGERPWPEWEARYVHREAGALRQAREQHHEAIETTCVTQFLFDRQWRQLKAHAAEKRIYLFGDVPIYIALDSADAWANREMLLIDDNGVPSAVAGVPPDYFSEDGQLWGNPLYDWDYHAATGYAWWIERMRHIGRQTDLVRIDHFRGFESFWAVPHGAPTARTGEWVSGPGDALFAAMRDALGDLPIVAEDLGLITPAVIELRKRQGLPGMVVLQFEVANPAFDPGKMDRNSVCYTGTHDNDTTAGWFEGSGDDARSEKEIELERALILKFAGGRPESLPRDMIRKAFTSRASLAMAPMQDYLGLGSAARMNTPGTTENNWCWRMPAGALTPQLKAEIAALVQSASRGG